MITSLLKVWFVSICVLPKGQLLFTDVESILIQVQYHCHYHQIDTANMFYMSELWQHYLNKPCRLASGIKSRQRTNSPQSNYKTPMIICNTDWVQFISIAKSVLTIQLHEPDLKDQCINKGVVRVFWQGVLLLSFCRNWGRRGITKFCYHNLSNFREK